MNPIIHDILRWPWHLGTAIVLLWNQTKTGKKLVTSEYTLTSKKLPKEFDGFRIVHLTDLHGRLFGAAQKDLIKKIRGLHPDIVLVTGDMYGYSTRPKDRVAPTVLFQRLSEEYPTYAILGNHETRDPRFDEILQDMLGTKVHLLRDEMVHLEKDGATIGLGGLETDEMRDLMQKENMEKLKERLETTFRDLKDHPEPFVILMAHKPELLEYYSRYQADLIFSGHAHGGLVEVPILKKRLLAPGQGLFPKYTEGLYLRDRSLMVLSTGLGGPRFYIQPEIVSVTLKKGK